MSWCRRARSARRCAPSGARSTMTHGSRASFAPSRATATSSCSPRSSKKKRTTPARPRRHPRTRQRPQRRGVRTAARAREPNLDGDEPCASPRHGGRRPRRAAPWPGSRPGGLGGLMLAAAPGSTAPIAIAPVLAVIAGVAGAVGGAGVGAGLAFAEAAARRIARSRSRPPRRWAAALSASRSSGWPAGASPRWSASTSTSAADRKACSLEDARAWALQSRPGAPATDSRSAPGRQAVHAAVIIALTCGLAGLVLTLAGRPLAGGTIHAIAHAAEGSRATLAPLGRLIGEPGFGPCPGRFCFRRMCRLRLRAHLRPVAASAARLDPLPAPEPAPLSLQSHATLTRA